MIDKIDNWNKLSLQMKEGILLTFLNNDVDGVFLVDYFEKYIHNLSNNSLNFYIKSVIKA